jgi:hypothetical protein
MKYNAGALDKIEKLLHETGYVIRYERGNFQSGYCILEEKKVLVLNKFLPLEGRINTLIDIIPQLKIEPEELHPDSRKLLENLMKPQA